MARVWIDWKPSVPPALVCRAGSVQPGDGPCPGLSNRAAVNHLPEGRMRENRTYGSVGGEIGITDHPYL